MPYKLEELEVGRHSSMICYLYEVISYSIRYCLEDKEIDEETLEDYIGLALSFLNIDRSTCIY